MDVILRHIMELGKELNLNIYLVGGALRDLLLNRNINDFDFVVEREHKKLITAIVNMENTTLVTLDEERQIYRIVLKSGIILDFSPMEGEDIAVDLSHRDFTINSMAYNIENGWPVDKDRIIDPFKGIQDLRDKRICHIDDRVFEEDPIRMLRAVTFMTQLGFKLDRDTQALVVKDAKKITTVAGERITGELFKILGEKRSYYYFNFMDKDLFLLEYIFPEIKKMKEVGKCKYHLVDSWKHSIYTMKLAESYIYDKDFFECYISKAYQEHFNEVIAGDRRRFQLIKLGAFFHDVGKPLARWVDKEGRTRFKGHELIGAEIVKKYANHLKLSKKEGEILQNYVALHMWPLVLYKKNDVSGRSLYKFFNEANKETLDILIIALGDIIATRRILDPYEEMGKFKTYIEYMASNYLTRYKEIEDISMIITGEDIMRELNINPGIKVGRILKEVQRSIYVGNISANREEAMKYIKDIY